MIPIPVKQGQGDCKERCGAAFFKDGQSPPSEHLFEKEKGALHEAKDWVVQIQCKRKECGRVGLLLSGAEI